MVQGAVLLFSYSCTTLFMLSEVDFFEIVLFNEICVLLFSYSNTALFMLSEVDFFENSIKFIV